RSGGRTIFMCTHDLAEAQKLCNRVGVMGNGALVALGTPEELAHSLQKGVRVEIELAKAPITALLGPRAEMLEAPSSPPSLTWDEATHIAGAWLPTRASIPDLIDSLIASGARIYGVTRQEPSLEDVYFALHDSRESNTPAGDAHPGDEV
ncbi:MAG: hypothetical protein MUQ30_07495, partial [Anaerolineae bacterium]|nr:hypothetical protein [Anaerolineae bacterium]